MSFVTYKKVYDKVELDSFLDLLKTNDIPFEVEDVLRNFNPAMTPRDGSIEMRVKILSSYFDEVRRLETEELKPLLDNVESDYYLFSFSNNDLKDLIKNGSEWSLFDVLLAEKILQDKGDTPYDYDLETLKNENRIFYFEEKSLSTSQFLIILFIFVFLPFLGYLFGKIILELLTLIGFILGMSFVTQKKTFPDGSQKYVYDKSARSKGKIIAFITGFILIFIFVMLVFFKDIDPSFL